MLDRSRSVAFANVSSANSIADIRSATSSLVAMDRLCSSDKYLWNRQTQSIYNIERTLAKKKETKGEQNEEEEDDENEEDEGRNTVLKVSR